jgi:hypothetical protein
LHYPAFYALKWRWTSSKAHSEADSGRNVYAAVRAISLIHRASYCQQSGLDDLEKTGHIYGQFDDQSKRPVTYPEFHAISMELECRMIRQDREADADAGCIQPHVYGTGR